MSLYNPNVPDDEVVFLKYVDRSVAPKWNPVYFSTENMNLQEFSLPRSTVMYMIKRRKELGLHQKFMRLCKYAYDKNRIVPVWHLGYRKEQYSSKSSWSGQWDEADMGFCNREKVDIVNGDYKIWILKSRYLGDLCQTQRPNLISTLIAKAYCIDSDISIVGQSLTWEEFLFLANGKRNQMSLSYGGIVNADGSGLPASIGSILASLPDIKSIAYRFLNPKKIDNATIKKEVDAIFAFLSRPGKITDFGISGLTDEFDIDSIAPLLMATKGVSVSLFFTDELSPDYKDKLELLIRRIVEKFPKYPNVLRVGPSIFFNGQSRESLFEIFL